MSYIIKEFKPCPFCGRIWMSVENYSEGSGYSVRCRCGAKGPYSESKEEAIKAWNIRDQHILWNPFRCLIRFPKNMLSVDLKGNIDSLDLATILQVLSAKNKTGLLQLVRNHVRSVICLKDGDIIAASDSKGNRMGQILFKNGMISREKLDVALKTARAKGRMLGDILLTNGYIDRQTLSDVIRQQVQEAVLDLFLWKDGCFEYRDCFVDLDSRSIKAVNTMEIILESSRRVDKWDELHGKKEG